MATAGDPVTEQLPFHVVHPKLLSSRPRSQVFQCDYTRTDETSRTTPSIVKIFSPRGRVAYEKELAVYSLTAEETNRVTTSRLWYGQWTAEKYEAFLGGKLPSVLRKQESQVSVIVLSYIQDAHLLSRSDSSNRLLEVRAALRALLQLHKIGILHGDTSADNVLIRGSGDWTSATWIDFSASVTNASKIKIQYEWNKTGIDASSLLPSDSEQILIEPQHESQSNDFNNEEMPHLPEIPQYITFSNVEYIAEGTHAVVYKVRATGKEQHTRCLKLYHQHWDTPYNLESTAFAYLERAGVEKVIPKVYGYGFRPRSEWGLDCSQGEADTLHHGILMEWIEDAEVLSEKNVTIDLAVNFIRGLILIHNAGILHSDTFAHNMLVVPSKKRSVWIDFSCAELGAEPFYDQEAWGAAGISIRMLMARTKQETMASIRGQYELSTTPLFYRISALTYVLWLLSEGVVGTFHCSNAAQTGVLLAPGMKYSIPYFLSASLGLVLLHVYLGHRMPAYSFRYLLFFHKVAVTAILCFQYAGAHTADRAVAGFQLALLSFCALGEARTFVTGLKEMIASRNTNVRKM